mmetsp:Transcript_41268/g.74608  ORF Transcript_41268/g.74608 Transcript_41268/m.74608 type:complete len:328 (-) Transcript_41268:40-1023(-)
MPTIDGGVLRRLLRFHPKLHPDCPAAEEYRQLGLGHLPFLDWDEARPWGRLLEPTSDEMADAPEPAPVPAGSPQLGQAPPPQKDYQAAVPPAVLSDEEPQVVIGGGPLRPVAGPSDSINTSLAAIQAEEVELFRRMQDLERRRAKVADAALNGRPKADFGDVAGAYPSARGPCFVANVPPPRDSSARVAPTADGIDAERQVQQPQRGMSMDLAAVEAEEAALLAELGGLDKQLEGQMSVATDEGARSSMPPEESSYDIPAVDQATEAVGQNDLSRHEMGTLERDRTTPPEPVRSPAAPGPSPLMPKASPPAPKIGARPAARPPRPSM